MTKISCICSKDNNNVFDIYIKDILEAEIEIIENQFNIPWERLFSLAVRQNIKRKHLFVSKVLGKHIPVQNSESLLVGALLSGKYNHTAYGKKFHLKDLLLDAFFGKITGSEAVHKALKENYKSDEKAIFIGFAETATALGYSVFRFAQNNSQYIHTTREYIKKLNPICFTEDHSHATDHFLYAEKLNIFKEDVPIVFIDDEISTGKTILNIISKLHSVYPRKEYYVVSILDFRNQEDENSIRGFEKLHDISIKFVSLLKARLKKFNKLSNEKIKTENTYTPSIIDVNNTKIEMVNLSEFFEYESDIPGKYLVGTGRFGVDLKTAKLIENNAYEALEHLKTHIIGEKVLFVGTGEFMYIPMLMANYYGNGCHYQSTTRSPIFAYPDNLYAVNSACCFKNPENPSQDNFIYNVTDKNYDTIIIFFERAVSKKEINNMLSNIEKSASKIIIAEFNGG